MFKRVPQPPIQPGQRDTEQHRRWPGFAAAAAGVVLALWGACHLTGVETVSGRTASEFQLIRAFSTSGLQYPQDIAPAPPPRLDDPAAEAEALDRWAKNQANAAAPTWKVRVDTTAKTPCPT